MLFTESIIQPRPDTGTDSVFKHYDPVNERQSKFKQHYIEYSS